MTRNLSTIARSRLAVAARRRAAPADAAKRFTIRGAGFGHGVGMSQYGAMGYASHGWDYKRILAHYYTGTALGVLNERARGARAAAVHERQRVVLGRHAGGRQGALAAQDLHACAAAPAARCSCSSRRGRVLATVAAPLRATGPRPAHAQGARRQRARERRPTAARSSSAPARSAGSTRSTPSASTTTCRASCRSSRPSSWPIEALKAQAVAARTYALTTTQGRRRLRPLPGHALAGLRRRGRRGRRRRTRRRRRPPASSSPTRARPVATYFFSTSGGRTEDVENTSLGDDAAAVAQVGRGRVRQRLPAPPLGADPDELRERAGQARLARARALQGHQGDHARPLAADRRRRRRRLARAHARRRRDAARALRPLRHVGLLHVDHDAQGAQAARRPTTATAAPRRRVVARAPKIASLAGSVIPARARRRDHASSAASAAAGSPRGTATAPAAAAATATASPRRASTACATAATPGPARPRIRR